MKKDKLDKVIEYTFKSNSENIEGIGDIAIPDFDEVMNRFQSAVEEKKTDKKHNSKTINFKRTLAVAASFLILLFTSTLLSEVSEVRAFKFNVMKTFEDVKDGNKTLMFSVSGEDEKSIDISGTGDTIEQSLSFEEAQKKVKFNILQPEFLPKEYKFKEITLIDKPFNRQQVRQIYAKNDKQIIIQQTTYSENKKTTVVANEESQFEKVHINNQEVTLIFDNAFAKAIWFSERFEFKITVFDSLSKEELVTLIESLK